MFASKTEIVLTDKETDEKAKDLGKNNDKTNKEKAEKQKSQ